MRTARDSDTVPVVDERMRKQAPIKMLACLQADVGALTAGDVKTLFKTLPAVAPQLAALLLTHAPRPPRAPLSGGSKSRAATGGKPAAPPLPSLKSNVYVAAQQALAARLQLRSSKVCQRRCRRGKFGSQCHP